MFLDALCSLFSPNREGFRVLGQGFRVLVKGLEFWVKGLEFWVLGLELTSNPEP
jgi:hypothetical protein